MKLEQSFTVEAPIEQVWAALIDVERIAPCLPGADITGRDDDGAYRGTFSVKLGPTSASYNGVLRMEKVDDANHVATMSARGTDKRGQGGANATIVSTLVEQDGGTRVDVDTDFTITGKLARFGRGGMIQDVSKRLMRDFASCLQETITGGHAAPAAAVATTAPVATGADAAAGADAPTAQPVGSTSTASGAATQQAGAPPRPAPKPAKPVNAFSLFLSVLGERAKRLAPAARERLKPLIERVKQRRRS